MAQQPPPQDLEGLALRSWLKTHWYDGNHADLGYAEARRQLFGKVAAENGKVTCAYSGFQQDASFDTYLNPINTEHIVPQSLFSSQSPMRSDLHHLLPTHQDVNGGRGSFPFGEVEDAQTDRWYFSNGSSLTIINNIPTSNIDAYSELDEGQSFEPREDIKGDVARAVFYFFTMYPTQAGSINQLGDVNTLYQWHLDDPVDAEEENRNTKVAEEQGNLNPYISHPEILGRAWGFEGVDPDCVEPETPASAPQTRNLLTTQATIGWLPGDGQYRLVMVSQSPIGDLLPEDGRNYAVTSTYGGGDQIGNAFCVYFGTGDSVMVGGLLPNTAYRFAIFEADCQPVDYLTSSYVQGQFTTTMLTGLDQAHQLGIEVAVMPEAFLLKAHSQSAEPLHFSVVDTKGRQIRHQRVQLPHKIDTQGWPAGLYLLQLQRYGQSTTIKLMKP